MAGTAISAPRARRTPRLPWRRVRAIDWPLVVAVALAMLAGTLMIYSATLRMEAATTWDDLVVKQAVFAAMSTAILLLMTLTEYRVLLALWVWLYAGVVVGLLALFSLGQVLGGAQRWYDLGRVAVQPSEFSKVVLVICLAAYFERHDVRQLRHVVISLGLVALLAFLVVLQPNLSTAILLGVIWLGMAFAAGMRPLHFSLLALLGAPTLFIALKTNLLRDYQLERVRVMLDPTFDASGSGYQSIQSLIAVGNGGLWGRGFASGMQTQGGWLPLMYTDNIFALISEELGFVGGLAFLLLLGFIVWRVFRAASVAQDFAGSLIAIGVGTYLLAQTFVNIGVVLQLLPVTGISLPLISYGGSSVLAVLTAIGLVQSVLVRRKPLEFA
ncbi:rod shape-determining protein RodA [bacterium]|nr:MAG: rod shape-determining protein RodA [bacterium]